VVQYRLYDGRLGPKGAELYRIRDTDLVGISTSFWNDHQVLLLTSRSLSEYGCLDNGRDFGEVAALMSNKMTGVYSGGLVYEYSWGPNNFGMVNITGNGPNDIQELGDFAKYQRALSNNPAPTGDGGFVSESKPMDCPPQDPSWLVDSKELPVIPTEAQNVCSGLSHHC